MLPVLAGLSPVAMATATESEAAGSPVVTATASPEISAAAAPVAAVTAPRSAPSAPAQQDRVAAFGAAMRGVWSPAVAAPPGDEIGELIEARLKSKSRAAVRSRKAIAAVKTLRRSAERRRERQLIAVREVRAARAQMLADLALGIPPLPVRRPDLKPLVPAKLLFGAARNAAPLSARSIGFYSRGCLAGAKSMQIDGPAWQVMRLSRNRFWGHPNLIALIERFAREAKSEDGWPGLLVGDISQARGGPMLTGHSSHQIGLDADIWFTPMPDRRLSAREREDMSAVSMISGPTAVNREVFTDEHVQIVKRAASYPQVERILVHPAIKKAMCEATAMLPPADRAWLGKVRPYFGHHYHFHVRITCPPGSANCRAQAPTKPDDGCGKELDEWMVRLTRPEPPPPPPGYKPPPPKPPLTLADLPPECRVVLDAGRGPQVRDEAELIKTSIEASKRMIDISGAARPENIAVDPATAAVLSGAPADAQDDKAGNDGSDSSDAR